MSSQATLACLLAVLIGNAHAQSASELPSSFEVDRVYVTPTTQDGQVLRLYTDSGGGLFLTQGIVERLGLRPEPLDEDSQRELAEEVGAQEASEARQVPLPAFAKGKGIPPPGANEGRLQVMPTKIVEQQRKQMPGLSSVDGMLGQSWFSGRIWTWDYPGKRLRIEGADWRPPAGAQRVAIGFKTDAGGKRNNDFPRIDVTIDGRNVSLLLDTGATTVLTPGALAAVDDGLAAERATSMITESVFEAWRKSHPDWRVIENAQTGSGSAMIEVPAVEIAGHRIGPVWFTHRADRNFHGMMSSMMDARVDGAIGGNALRHFVMTIDYPGAAAWFRCVIGCESPR